MSSKTPPVLSQSDNRINAAVLDRVPVKWALRFHIFPLEWDGSILKIAVEESFDISLIPEIQFYLRTSVSPVRVSGKEIEENIRIHYGVGAQIIDAMRDRLPEKDVLGDGLAQNETISDISIGKLVEHIIRQACNERATDIHIEPYPGAVKVRYRIDGLLCDAKVPQDIRLFKDAIISRIKILASLNIAQRRLPQDGRFNFRIDDREVDCRVSVLPTSFGEGIVIRILNALKPCQLKELGLSKQQESVLKGLLQKEHGIIFVTGPTGSGKTTTLYSCLQELHREDRKIITLEDPVEYQLPGVMQVQVHPSIGLSFAQGLRSMLRHDPDIMMVGEDRTSDFLDTSHQ
jgi:general secretion pathway protein E